MTTVRVGVAGLGVVGGATVRLLRERAGDFKRRLGAEVRVDAVCDRQAAREARRLGLGARVRRARSWRDLAADPALDAVVETMGGLGEARGFVLAALASGKHVVTANKRLLAHHWEDIFGAAGAARRSVRFEASVAGGIPILQALHQSLAGNRIRRVLGILNGTTNFVLTRMGQAGLGLAAAVAEAQRLGLAERDPSMDLEGTDAVHKVSVLASLVTGRWVPPEAVERMGILGVTSEDLRFARQVLGRTVKLLGCVELDWSARPAALSAHVFPTLVPLEHPLASVHGENNAVLVQASAAGDLMFYGKGAGPGPAASAVVGDLFMLASDIASGRSARAPAALWSDRRATVLVGAPRGRASFYLRLRVADRPGALALIAGELGRRRISISQIHQERPRGGAGPVPVVITTHPARASDMDHARRAILALPGVARAHGLMRMLDA